MGTTRNENGYIWKNIKLPRAVVSELEIRSQKKGWSVKKYMEVLLIKHVTPKTES